MEKNQFAEQVFDTANGYLVQEACVPGIENMFAPGTACDLLYRQMVSARERLTVKTGLQEDDPDIEGIIDPLLKITKVIGLEMFAYGMKYGRKEQKIHNDHAEKM